MVRSQEQGTLLSQPIEEEMQEKVSSRVSMTDSNRNSSKKQTIFFLLVDPMDKSHKDRKEIDLSLPSRAQYLTMHGKNIKTRYIGSTSILQLKKD